MQSERHGDTTRIGVWGSGISGVLAVYAAGHDPRVKVLQSQVPAPDGRWVVATEQDPKSTYEESTKRAAARSAIRRRERRPFSSNPNTLYAAYRQRVQARLNERQTDYMAPVDR